MDETNPTARALLCLELLQDTPGIGGDGLAGKLGVSSRAARRYVAILRRAGIPVESVPGRYGGYRLGRGLRVPPLMFSAVEALSLVMAVLDGHHAASDPGDLVGGALGKILRALPEPVAAQAEAVRRSAAAAPDRSAVRPDPDTTTVLVRACSGNRRVRLRYRSEAESEWEMEVDPWAVVVRHGRWYLLCHSHTAGARRAFRVDRIRRVEIMEDTFVPPTDLDAVGLLEDHLAAGWEFEAEVVIDAPLDRVARRVPRAIGRLEPVDDRTTRLAGSTSNPAWYAEQLALIPAPFRVVGCPEIQRAVLQLGQRLLAAADSRPRARRRPRIAGPR